jgi:hypothetical protein
MTDLYYTSNSNPNKPPCGSQTQIYGITVTNTSPRKIISINACPGSPTSYYLTQYNYSNGVIDNYIDITSWYTTSGPKDISYYNGKYYLLYSDGTLISIEPGNPSNYSFVASLPAPYLGVNEVPKSLSVIFSEIDQNLF